LPQTEYRGVSDSPLGIGVKTNGSKSTEDPAALAAAPSVADDDAIPLGAVPFTTDLLKLRVPASAQLDADALASALGTGPLYGDQPSGAVSLDRASTPLAHSHGVAPVPLPLDPEGNQLSETQVFATSDLYPMHVEEVEASIEQMPLAQELHLSTSPHIVAPPPAPPSATVKYATPPVTNRQGTLTPEQAAQARQLLQELASLPDVGFVKLLGSDGTVMASSTKEITDSTVDEHIAVLIGFAIMEVGQLGLGEWTSMAVEAPGMALLLSPLSGGASLAILLSNPARLGLLRRQLRKPLSGLQEVLSGARVS
jgi:predicted regulator of Ras-like GTPase activity (Roadblock/LC7/MglB family)